MKILHVIQTMSPAWGGPTFQLTELTERLQLQGLDNTILTFSPTKDRTYVDKLRGLGVEIVESKSRISRYPISLSLFHELPRMAARADVVHLWGFWGFHNFVYRFAKTSQTPYVISALNDLLQTVLRSHVKKYVFQRLVGVPLLKRAAAAVAITAAESAEYIRVGVCPERVHTIPLAVPEEFFEAVAPQGERIPGPLRILFLGRLHESKGVQYVLPALARLRDEVPSFKFLLVGPDHGFRPVLEQIVRELSLTDVVEFLGPAYGAEKVQYFRNADVFVFPSMFEQIGHVILEAASAGLPCLYTTHCSFPVLANAGGGIETVLSEEPLYRALKNLLVDPSLRSRMGCSARELIARDFLWSRVARSYAEMYKGCANGAD